MGIQLQLSQKRFEILAQTESKCSSNKNLRLYKALLNKDHKSVDKNNNGKIEKKELKKVFYINLYEGGSYDMNVKAKN